MTTVYGRFGALRAMNHAVNANKPKAAINAAFGLLSFYGISNVPADGLWQWSQDVSDRKWGLSQAIANYCLRYNSFIIHQYINKGVHDVLYVRVMKAGVFTVEKTPVQVVTGVTLSDSLFIQGVLF